MLDEFLIGDKLGLNIDDRATCDSSQRHLAQVIGFHYYSEILVEFHSCSIGQCKDAGSVQKSVQILHPLRLYRRIEIKQVLLLLVDYAFFGD